jgi:copper chaperone CopZ
MKCMVEYPMRSLFCFLFVACQILQLNGCSRTGDVGPSAIDAKTTPAAFNTAGAPTVEFSVPDMMCPEGCGAKVKEILSQQPGAKDVVVDFPAKKAIVAVDKDKFDAKQAIAALVDHQFKHSALSAATPSTAEATPPPAKAKSVQ